MFGFPPEAIDITAALARSTMSLAEAAGAFAGLASAESVAGASAASLAGAGCGEICLDFDVSTGAESEASLGASTDADTEASFGASVSGIGSTPCGATACGEAAAKRSLNISEADAIVAGAEITGAGSASAA